MICESDSCNNATVTFGITMPIQLIDPTIELKNRARMMNTLGRGDPFDDQELREREEAAEAYAGENEKHFVDYGNDCIKQSVDANKDVRELQNDCWNVYNENEPASYADKDSWMSRIIVPKPFSAVQYGASAVKKAFSPNYLTIKNPQNKQAAIFWEKVMEHQLNEQHASFMYAFVDATIMALAIGISLEVIPRFVPGRGLRFTLVEPWKIQRDPDAESRDPQSGMFWIHQEWLDYFVLKKGEQAGRYFDVARVKDVTENQDDIFMTKEAIRDRKEQIWDDRSKYRKMILTNEFWGIVLDPKGNLLLPRATYTFAGNRVIQYPKTSPYRTLRWPGIAFSPLPDLLKFGGRGLLEGALTIWEAMNNLMCLHHDYLQWVVNPPTEINVDGLQDPDDVEVFPGKKYITHDTPNGAQAVRVVQRRSRTSDIMANVQQYDQHFQRGTFVTDAVQGLPGYRKDMTFRESAMLMDQAMGVYGLMGQNIEDGAIKIITASQEIISQMAGYDTYKEIFTEEQLYEMGVSVSDEAENGLVGVPVMDGSFHVSGMQALMKENESLAAIKEIVLPLMDHPRMGKYIKPYETAKAIEERTNLMDEGLFVDEDKAKQIDAQEIEAVRKQEESQNTADETGQMNALLDMFNKIKMERGNKPNSQEAI